MRYKSKLVKYIGSFCAVFVSVSKHTEVEPENLNSMQSSNIIPAII